MMGRMLYGLGWLFIALLVLAAVGDLRRRKIDPRLVYAMLAVALVKIILEIVWSGMYFTGLWAAFIACGVTTLVFWGMYRFSHGIGLGDVKLMAACSLFYGIQGTPSIVIVSMLLVSLVGIGMVIKDRRNLKAELPFAPFVAAAAILREMIIVIGI